MRERRIELRCSGWKPDAKPLGDSRSSETWESNPVDVLLPRQAANLLPSLRGCTRGSRTRRFRAYETREPPLLHACVNTVNRPCQIRTDDSRLMRPAPYLLANGQRSGRYLIFVKSGNVRVGLRPGCSGHGRIVLATVVCILACL